MAGWDRPRRGSAARCRPSTRSAASADRAQLHDLARAADVLTEVMNMRRLRDYVAPDAAAQVHVFGMGEGGPAAELHVIGA
jgi:hypothetical protein